MAKFSLNQIPRLNHKFTIANFFIILIRQSIRRQSLNYASFGGLLYILGALWKHFVYSKYIHLFRSAFPPILWECTFKILFWIFMSKKYLFLFVFLVRQKKNISNFDKSKLFLINSVPIVLLIINHIRILPLDYHLFNNRYIQLL